MVLAAKGCLIDASVWVAYFDTNDTLHRQAQSVLNGKTDTVLLLTDYIVQEVITVFLYKKQHQLIEELMKTIQKENVEIISVESSFLKSLLKFIKQFSYSPKISLADWSLMFLAEELGLPISTFDKQLNNTYSRLAA